MPSAIANLMKGGRYITDGEATTMRGDPITEDLNPWNMGAQLFGFAPAQYTQQLERSAMNKRIDRKVNEKRTRLLREYYMAYRQGDRDTMQDTLSEMVELGQKFPAVAITGETIRRSIKQHELTSALMKKYGGVTITRNMQAYIDAINAEIED